MTVIISHKKCTLLFVGSDSQLPSDQSGIEKIIIEIGTKLDIPVQALKLNWISDEHIVELSSRLKLNTIDGDRNCLLIAGAFLENQITICTLGALAEGFDVYLLTDLIIAQDEKFIQNHQFRLFQAGAVPSTLKQFLYFWRAAETSDEDKLVMSELMHKYS